MRALECIVNSSSPQPTGHMYCPGAYIAYANILHQVNHNEGFPGDSAVKYLPAMQETGSIPGSGRSTGEGSDNPLQYSCLQNPNGQRTEVGDSTWGRKELEMTKQLCTHKQLLYKVFFQLFAHL